MKKTIPVIGMACSVCSANVEKKLQSLEGINSASVSLASRTALVDYDPDIISLEDIGRFALAHCRAVSTVPLFSSTSFRHSGEASA